MATNDHGQPEHRVGGANLAAGLFQGFPVSTSGSRTAVAEQARKKTQVTGLVGAGAIVLIPLFFPGLLRNLSQPTSSNDHGPGQAASHRGPTGTC